MIDITGMRFVVTNVAAPLLEATSETGVLRVVRGGQVLTVEQTGGRYIRMRDGIGSPEFVAVPVPVTDVQVLALAVLTGDATAGAPFVDAYLEVNGTDVNEEVLKEERRKAIRWVRDSIFLASRKSGLGLNPIISGTAGAVIDAIDTLGLGYVENGE